MENDLSYFMRRAAEERSAALSSQDLRAMRSHKELAARYEDLIRRVSEIGENCSPDAAEVVANEH